MTGFINIPCRYVALGLRLPGFTGFRESGAHITKTEYDLLFSHIIV
jgi:hypothetical protein